MRLASVSLVVLAAIAGAAGTPEERSYQNPVIAGDHPDPSVIRVDDTYWLTHTSGMRVPTFPLYTSRDLIDWKPAGFVFATPPGWASGDYWAPEIAEHGGRYFVYYTARRQDGPLCVAVATAPEPGGPYEDHGPLVCQTLGSIDAAPATDERGRRYLVWKEDGNSQQQPTPLWAQPLSADGTRLEGRPREILRNDAPWEGHLIEGPYILRRDGWFYLFYSARGCCGERCDYRLGVARSRALLGPWERSPANPILPANEVWSCPGHGSIVADPRGRTFLLYHAYKKDDFERGRQALLDEVVWGEDGWPTINGGQGPSIEHPAPFGVD